MNTTADEEKPIGTTMCGSRKYHTPHPHGGSWKFQGVEGCKRAFFFPRRFEMRSNKTLKYMLHFKDRAVFSLNATGAFSDGITRAVS